MGPWCRPAVAVGLSSSGVWYSRHESILRRLPPDPVCRFAQSIPDGKMRAVNAFLRRNTEDPVDAQMWDRSKPNCQVDMLDLISKHSTTRTVCWRNPCWRTGGGECWCMATLLSCWHNGWSVGIDQGLQICFEIECWFDMRRQRYITAYEYRTHAL